MNKKNFQIGSDWIYLKLYCCPFISDNILIDLDDFIKQNLNNTISNFFL